LQEKSEALKVNPTQVLVARPTAPAKVNVSAVATQTRHPGESTLTGNLRRRYLGERVFKNTPVLIVCNRLPKTLRQRILPLVEPCLPGGAGGVGKDGVREGDLPVRALVGGDKPMAVGAS
jgi:hypothetical protein